jgi:hypothetical protein
MKNIFIGLSVVVVVALALWAIDTGLKKQERNECKKWQYEATRYQGYYLTENQKEQCKSLNIPIIIK